MGTQAAEITRLKEAGGKPSEIADRLGINRASMYRLLDGNAGVISRRLHDDREIRLSPGPPLRSLG